VSGVNLLHGKKIVHRDLGVENIFICKYGYYKIGDLSVLMMQEEAFEVRNIMVGTLFSFLSFLFFSFFFSILFFSSFLFFLSFLSPSHTPYFFLFLSSIFTSLSFFRGYAALEVMQGEKFASSLSLSLSLSFFLFLSFSFSSFQIFISC
jgi:serine/threonine protein kinase